MKKLAMLLMLLLALTIQSHRVLAQSVTITLMPGWNWISVPLMDTLDFETALGSFTPMSGDVIKSQWSNATYMSNGQWRGPISQFYPGYGYMYYSNRPMPVMVTFTTQQPAPQVIVTTMEPTDITANSATCGGNVASSDGNYVFVILRGICWSTNPNPTFNDNYVEVGNGIGSFTASMTELNPHTTYYMRAFAVTSTGTFYGNEFSFYTIWSNGILPGAFSVSENQQVCFSQGNLQYKASTNTWRFAENQYDYVGSANHNISFYYNGWIDLFGWGTSGWNSGNTYYRPWDSSNSSGSTYGPRGSYNLTGSYANADWGVYNQISNGGNQSNQWRTLTQPEWNYVFNTRTTTSGIRYAMANVNGVNGVILLPDDWSISTYSLSNTNNIGTISFNSNTLTASQWNTLEQAGAVFLPTAGYRNGKSVEDVGYVGEYWSASCDASFLAWSFVFLNGGLVSDPNYRYYGRSVRLVRDVE